jgi:uncharacterized coiled-coil DUF342 family protein
LLPFQPLPESKPDEEEEGKKQEDNGSGPEGDGEDEDPVEKIDFGPIPDNGSDLIEDLQIPSRVEMVAKMVKKHMDMVSKYSDELKALMEPPKEVKEESTEEKTIRDKINDEVAKLKDGRTRLKEENKSLRSEFFDLIRKEEKVKDHESDVKMHQDFMEQLEWKLSTEAIDIKTERRLLDQLKSTMNELRSLTDGLTPDEIKEKLTAIQEKIGENLTSIEDLHSQMLEKVSQSNVHHEKFIDAQKKVRETESRKGWLERRIKLHEEMKIFWEGQTDQAKQMDDEESKRPLEAIRDSLVKLFEERDREKGGDEKKKGRKSGPRKKLEMKEEDKKAPGEDKPSKTNKKAPSEVKKESSKDAKNDVKKAPSEEKKEKPSKETKNDKKEAPPQEKKDEPSKEKDLEGDVKGSNITQDNKEVA